MPEEFFKSGQLLLDQMPSAEPVAQAADFSAWLVPLSMGLFILLVLVFFPRFRELLPLLLDSLFRTRGSAELERSVRASHDRNMLAILLLIIAPLVLYQYRVYDPAFIRNMEGSWGLLAVAGVVLGYLLLRIFLYHVLKPRRGIENYRLARHTVYTYYCCMAILILATVVILVLFRIPAHVVRIVLWIEMAASYLLILARRTQILALSCNPLRTFLYLCGLELLPTAALVISAFVL